MGSQVTLFTQRAGLFVGALLRFAQDDR